MLRSPDPERARPDPVIDCDWLNAQLDALYEHDHRGWITTRREPDRSSAPRFHLGRSRHGNVWRVRADQPAWLARRLSRLAAREAPLAGAIVEGSLPERSAALRAALEELAPVEASWSGPVLRESAAATSRATIQDRASGSERVDPAGLEPIREIADAFPALASTIALRAPIFASREAGRIVSVCYRTSGSVQRFSEPGVDTLPGFRRRGHAVRALAGWWIAVVEAGGTPLYSTSWDDAASLGVARSLGLEVFADSCHWS